MVKKVVSDLAIRRPFLKDFKYVYDYEWEVIPGMTNQGKGDLILTDLNNNFLIVECKKKNTKDLRTQVLDYMQIGHCC